MTATHATQFTSKVGPVLYLSMDLGENSWTLGFTVGMGQRPRLRTIRARDTATLLAEITKAKQRFNLPEDASVRSCYEAGRDGFWLHRFLVHHGIANVVVESSSIETNRRKRRAKSDPLDTTKLVEMLIRWYNGESRVWRVVNVPAVEDEARRQLNRELTTLKDERTEHSNRIKGLLASLGLGGITVNAGLPPKLEKLRQWDGAPLPAEYKARILRELERWKLVDAQIRQLEIQQRRTIRDQADPQAEQMALLLMLKGVGVVGAWVAVREIFGWRQIKNRRQLAGLVGLTPTPYSSGESQREQGISKAGNDRVRCLLIELAWAWLRYQPQSDLSRWYHKRFGSGNSRMRKVGIVALARKLLIALWKYLDRGEIPQGAILVDWKQKLNGKPPSSRRAS
jgi:transposase